jgi:hypothetical protein
MSNNVLYFPYISVPSSTWFTRTLLYWDTVGSIVPYDYIEKPEMHDEYTRSLVQANLVTQVIPGVHLYRIPQFTDSFIGYLESLDPVLTQRRVRALKRHSTHIHMEKMGSIADELVKMGLAVYRNYPWYDVESDTADDFMSYLSTVLGRLPDLQFSPVTDQIGCLNRLSANGGRGIFRRRELDTMRLQILEDALPGPTSPLEAHEIELFKNRHGDRLSRFRREIELELTTLADMNDFDLQQRRLELFKEKVREETADIRIVMEKQGWKDLVFGKLCALLAAVPGISPVPKLINAVYKAFADSDSFDKKSPFAYAAYAQKELIGKRRPGHGRQNLIR